MAYVLIWSSAWTGKCVSRALSDAKSVTDIFAIVGACPLMPFPAGPSPDSPTPVCRGPTCWMSLLLAHTGAAEPGPACSKGHCVSFSKHGSWVHCARHAFTCHSSKLACFTKPPHSLLFLAVSAVMNRLLGTCRSKSLSPTAVRVIMP